MPPGQVSRGLRSPAQGVTSPEKCPSEQGLRQSKRSRQTPGRVSDFHEDLVSPASRQNKHLLDKYSFSDAVQRKLAVWAYGWGSDASWTKPQLDAIEGLAAGHHVVTYLPTGAGKSDVFFSFLSWGPVVFAGEKCRLLVCPTIALGEDLARRFNSRDLGVGKAIAINSSMEAAALDDFETSGDAYGAIIGTPEGLDTMSSKLCSILQGSWAADSRLLFVIDNAHGMTRENWGKFRKAYLSLPESRPLLDACSKKLQILAATATPCDKTRVLVDSMFQRQETVVRVEVPLVRADQYLEVLHSPFISDQNRQSAALQILVPLARLVICPDCPLAGRRMLIFAPDLATAAAIVSSLESLIALHGSLLQNDGKTPRQVQVTMANAQLTIKSEVVERLTRPASEEEPSFEIFVATTMVCEGVDVKSCSYTILYGTLGTISLTLQALGRVGRDMPHSFALLWISQGKYGRSDRVLKEVYATGCKLGSTYDKQRCLKAVAYQSFVQKALPEKNTNNDVPCCSICHPGLGSGLGLGLELRRHTKAEQAEEAAPPFLSVEEVAKANPDFDLSFLDSIPRELLNPYSFPDLYPS